MRRILTWLMVVALLAATAQAEEFLNDILYAENESGVSIDYFMGDYEAAALPEEIDGLPVTVIAANAFSNKALLGELTIPETVLQIEEGAFANSPNVHLIVAPGSAAETYAVTHGMAYTVRSGAPDFSVIPDGGVNPISGAEAVRALQRLLVRAGLMNLADVTGMYSRATENAVRNLQRHVGYLRGDSDEPDGVADEQTMVYLLWHPYSSTVADGVTPYSRPDEIRQVQEKLAQLGQSLAATGEYNLETIRGVQAFQQEMNAMISGADSPVTGICDSQTLVYIDYMVRQYVTPEPTASPTPVPTPEPTPEPVFPLTIRSAEKYKGRIEGGDGHLAGLSGGRVLTAGKGDDNQCATGGWQGIEAVEVGYYHTLGLNADDTVVAVGQNDYGQCNVSNWQAIRAIEAGGLHSVGLREDGTVVAVGSNQYGQCSVGNWTDIVAVEAGCFFTLGLKSDGTAVARGNNSLGQCNVDGWQNIVGIAAGGGHAVGLRADGTVVVVGDNDDGQRSTGGWTDIVAVAAGGYHTVGLKSDGTVVTAGKASDGQRNTDWWTDIVAIAAGEWYTMGIRSDGTVLCTDPAFNVSDWNLGN